MISPSHLTFELKFHPRCWLVTDQTVAQRVRAPIQVTQMTDEEACDPQRMVLTRGFPQVTPLSALSEKNYVLLV